jgi:hypothetical protein
VKEGEKKENYDPSHSHRYDGTLTFIPIRTHRHLRRYTSLSLTAPSHEKELKVAIFTYKNIQRKHYFNLPRGD